MSTRSQIKVIARGKEVMLYHHSDGYPEGVGYCLLKLLQKNHNGWLASEIVTNMVRNGRFEITFGKHSDIEYYYELNFDKEQVLCMEVNNWGKTMEIIRHIDLVYDADKDVMVDEELFKEEGNV